MDILVTGAQPASYPAAFRVNLNLGAAYGTATYLSNVSGASVEIPFHGSVYTIVWRDADGSATLTSGDDFRVVYPTGVAAPAPGTNASLLLVWEDGSTDAQVGWVV